MGEKIETAGTRQRFLGQHRNFPGSLSLISVLAAALAAVPALAASKNGQNFYLRADIGASFSDGKDGDLIDANGNRDVIQFDFGVSPLFQIGVGYRLNSYLRTDLTLAHRTDFGGTHPYLDAESGLVSGLAADLTSTSAFLNLYLDLSKLGNWNLGKFVPYVGAGIGWAMNDLGDGTLTATQQVVDGSKKHNFAYRLTAGTGYSLTDQLTVDVAYSYVDLGEAAGNEKVTAQNGAVGFIQRGIDVDLRAHEIMLGLRYTF